jgi:hypothetical protein
LFTLSVDSTATVADLNVFFVPIMNQEFLANPHL